MRFLPISRRKRELLKSHPPDQRLIKVPDSVLPTKTSPVVRPTPRAWVLTSVTRARASPV